MLIFVRLFFTRAHFIDHYNQSYRSNLQSYKKYCSLRSSAKKEEIESYYLIIKDSNSSIATDDAIFTIGPETLKLLQR